MVDNDLGGADEGFNLELLQKSSLTARLTEHVTIKNGSGINLPSFSDPPKQDSEGS